MKNFIVVGTNHRYSPIELREQISFSKKRLKEALVFLKERGVFKGAVILSTCNRVEIYASVYYTPAGIRELENFLYSYHEVVREKLRPYLYIYEGKEAVRHLFEVTCGLDSQILGETQILGQVRDAFFESECIDFADESLTKVFNQSISFAKFVHRESRISEGKISIGSVAVDFAREKIGTLSDKNILIIGVGKVNELVLKYLKKEGTKMVFISNRTFEKARDLARKIGAQAARFDKLKQFLNIADVLITATASPHFIIKKETFEGISGKRLFIFDLALPRDVDPKVKEVKNISLFSLEDLDAVIKKNFEKRIIEAERIKQIIELEVKRLWSKLTRLEPEPVLLP